MVFCLFCQKSSFFFNSGDKKVTLLSWWLCCKVEFLTVLNFMRYAMDVFNHVDVRASSETLKWF